MSSQGVQLTRDSRLKSNELTQAEYTEKFERPNIARLQKEKPSGTASDLNVKYSSDNPSFVDDTEIKEISTHDTKGASTVPSEAPSTWTDKTKSGRRNTRCLWIVIVILVILLATMTALFIWRIVCCDESNSTSTSSAAVPPNPTVRCFFLYNIKLI